MVFLIHFFQKHWCNVHFCFLSLKLFSKLHTYCLSKYILLQLLIPTINGNIDFSIIFNVPPFHLTKQISLLNLPPFSKSHHVSHAILCIICTRWLLYVGNIASWLWDNDDVRLNFKGSVQCKLERSQHSALWIHVTKLLYMSEEHIFARLWEKHIIYNGRKEFLPWKL